MKLAIISHTAHYKTSEGEVVGWGPTITEINHLAEVFDVIYHVAMLYEDEPPFSALPYKSDKIKFVALRPSGGKTVVDKLITILRAPKVIQTVSKTLKLVEFFQFRAPTGIGVYLLPYFLLFTKKKGWYKYAGNWNQKSPPLGYWLQRKMLTLQSRKVTINGYWKGQPKHCYTFENPCLTNTDIEEGKKIRIKKSIENKLEFCYVGRLEKQKGVERIIKAFEHLSSYEKERIGRVHLVGDGFEYEYFRSLAASIDVPFVFHGFRPRKDVFSIYKKCHFFLMPSTASEGFPKVIAEAMNFGCIPIVSDISSIGHYIKDGQNGFLIDVVSSYSLYSKIQKVISFDEVEYEKMITDEDEVLRKFTFGHYNKRIKDEILS